MSPSTRETEEIRHTQRRTDKDREADEDGERKKEWMRESERDISVAWSSPAAVLLFLAQWTQPLGPAGARSGPSKAQAAVRC